MIRITNTIVTGRSKPISNFPEISFGNMPNDGGNLLLSEEEKDEIHRLNSKREATQVLAEHP